MSELDRVLEQVAKVHATTPAGPYRLLSPANKPIWVIKKLGSWLANQMKDGILPPTNLASQVQIITGLGQTFVYEALYGPTDVPTVPTRMGRPPKLGDHDIVIARDIAYSLHGQKRHPKAKHILDRFLVEKKKADREFDVCLKTFYKFLKTCGFRFGHSPRGDPIVKEMPNIIHLRDVFLERYMVYRESGRKIYFTDETWIHVGDNHSGMSWFDNDPRSKNPGGKVSKGPMLIIAHIGSAEGWVRKGDKSNASFIMMAKKPDADYHKNMNAHNWEKWMSEDVIPFLEVNSVIVMDNVAFHKRVPDRKPTYANTIDDMKYWLINVGGLSEEDLVNHRTKLSLYRLIQESSIRKPMAIQEIIKNSGKNIDVLFLPPYHCEFNPIEFQWSQIKPFVKEHNVSQTEVSCQAELEAAFEITDHHWARQVAHCEKLMSERITVGGIEMAAEIEFEVEEVEVETTDEPEEDFDLLDPPDVHMSTQQ